MAKFVLKDAVVTINGTDLSDHFSECTIEGTADSVDTTGFTTASFRTFLPGFKEATITLTAFQDFAASSLDSVLYPMWNNSTDGTVKVRETTSSTIYWTMIGKLLTYSPIAGAVGDAATTPVQFVNSSTAGLTRGTS